MTRAACYVLVLGAVCGVAVAQTVTLAPTVPVAGQNLTITYDPTCTPLEGEQRVFLRYGFNGFNPTIDPDPMVTTNGAPYVVTVLVPAQATEINIAFRNDADPLVFDNNDEQDYDFAVTNGLPNSPRVSTVPSPIQAGTTVVVTYDPAGTPLDGVNPVYMHYGFNQWNPTNATDVLMTTNGVGGFVATVGVKSYASAMDLTFNDTGNPANPATVWDKNGDFDWHLEVTGTIEGVTISPNPPVANQSLTITFNPEDSPINVSTTGEVYIHWGINDFADAYGPDILMTSNGALWEGTIPSVPVRAAEIAFVFNDTGDINNPATIWDSNNSNDWRYAVDGAKPLTNELDALYVAKGTESGLGTSALIIGLAGNLMDNGSAFVIFIDIPSATGQTELLVNGVGGPGSMLAASRRNDLLSCTTVGEGTILPGEADYALFANRSGESIYFNQYSLSGTPLIGDELTCCGGGTLDTYASQFYAGATGVNDGNSFFEDDQALYYEGGFNDSDTNGTPGVSTSGLEIVIPYFDIGNLGNNQAISIFVGLMPNDWGVSGQFSNQMLPANSNGLCNPAEMLPLRSDLTGFTSVWTGNTGTLPTFSGTADGIIVPADYAGTADATQTCPAASAVPDTTVTTDTAIIHGATVEFTYISTNGPLDGSGSINMQYSYDDFATSSSIAMTADTCTSNAWTASIVIDSNGLPLQLSLVFDDGSSVDDNTGQLWEFEIARTAAGDIVTTNPSPPQSGLPVTVTYDPTGRNIEGGTGLSMHYGFNGWSGVTDVKMTQTVDCKWEVTIDVSSIASALDVVFFDTNGTWDTNDGNDWQFPVDFVGTPPAWTMDGNLDCCATLVGTSTNGLRHMYAGLKDGWVYIAVESTMGQAEDHFIFISSNGPTVQAGQPWAKGGTVGQWDGYLAQESTNSWVGWFDGISGFNTAPNDTTAPYLEGTFELGTIYPGLPTTIYIAHGAWGTNNGDPLVSALQVPQGNGDGNIDGNEYLALDLTTVEVTTFAEADLDQSCSVDDGDISLFNDCLGGPGAAPAGTCGAGIDADFDNDGDVDLVDFSTFMQSLSACPLP